MTEWGRFRKLGSEGQGLVEYALIIAFVALLVVTALAAFGGGLNNLFLRIASSWPR